MPSLMESIISLDVGAQEPWPNDVQLFQPYPIEQILLPDNANCLATQAYLNMCGLPFKIEHRSNAEFMSPSGKVPFIKCGAFVVSELEPIVQFVASKGISLTEDFDNEQKSDLRAYMSLIFSVLMNAELYICWCDKRTYNEVTKIRNGSVYPWPLNHYQNWTKRSAVIKKLKLLNWYQKTLGSVYQEVETCCQALSERLEGREYFFGSKPTEVDALLYGHTYSIFSNPVEFPNLFIIFQRFPNLIIHCRRICFHYTFLRYIDFTKTDTDIESSRESSIHDFLDVSETTIFTQIWNYITNHMYGHASNIVDISNEQHTTDSETDKKKIEQIPENISQLYKDIRFKKTVDPCINDKLSMDENIDSLKSINYLGHKVIQQHLQQDLRNKLSDFTIETNSDLWSAKDLCYIISDSDLIRRNKIKFVSVDKGDITTKENLKTKYNSSSSLSSNVSEPLDWLHASNISTIDVHSSNKFDADDDSFTEYKNDTLNDQENIEIDVDNKSNCNASELDWLTDYTSDTKVDSFSQNEINKEIVITLGTTSNKNLIGEVVAKFSNCTFDGGDSSKDTEIPMMDNIDDTLEEITFNCDDTALDPEPNVIYDLKSKASSAIYNLGEKCSTNSNTCAWTTIESASEVDSLDNLVADSMNSTVQLMNDMISSVEQMDHNDTYTFDSGIAGEKIKDDREKNSLQNVTTPKTKSDSEITLETYSDNHVCNEKCSNIYVANDDSFWDDDISSSKSTTDNDKSIKSFNLDEQSTIEVQCNKINLKEEHSDIKICCETSGIHEETVIDKISNESLKKYFSCESCKQIIGLIENSESCSSIIEEYPIENLSNIIISIEQPYPENEFLKLLTSDYDTNSNNCDDFFFEQNINKNVNTNKIEIENENNNNNPPKPRVFRKCRRLLNRSRDLNNATMRSDSKILQMYNEKLLEHRNKSINDIENIRTACSMLKSFNTQPEPCTACSLCKFASNPSISSSCKCDSNFKLKSKSVNKFSSVSAIPLDQFHKLN